MIQELLDLLGDLLDVSKAAVEFTTKAKKATDAGQTVVQTVADAEDASSFVDEVTLDGETVLEPAADLPPTAEEIGPLYRTLKATQPTIHEVKTDLHGVVIALAPVAAFVTLLGPILARRRDQSSSLATSAQNAKSVSAGLQRRYTDETLPPAIRKQVQALNAALRPIQADLRSATQALQAAEGRLSGLGVLESIGQMLEPVHRTLRAARDGLRPVRTTLRKIRSPLRRAKAMYTKYKAAATKRIKDMLSEAGFPTKTLEAFATGLENQIKGFIRQAVSPVDRLKSQVVSAIPKLPLDAVQQEIQRVDRQLTRQVDPLVPLLERFNKVAGQAAGLSVTPRRKTTRRRATAHK